MHNLCYTQLCCRRGFYGTGLGRCWSGWALRVAGVALGDINAAFFVAGFTFSDIDVVIRGTWWHRPSEAEKLTAWCQQPMVLARFVWLQIILSMRLSFTPRSQTYISKRPFHAQPSHKLLFNKHLCHTHTHLYPSPTGEEVAYCVIKSHSASLEKPYIHGHHVPNVLINQH